MDTLRTPKKKWPDPEYTHDPPHFREWSPYFLDYLAYSGNVSAAAQYAGVGRSTVYAHRANNGHFAAVWDDAIEQATDILELEARRRAAEGMEEPIYYQGELVGTVRRYSDTLLIFLLKAHRPEKFRDNIDITSGGERVGGISYIVENRSGEEDA